MPDPDQPADGPPDETAHPTHSEEAPPHSADAPDTHATYGAGGEILMGRIRVTYADGEISETIVTAEVLAHQDLHALARRLVTHLPGVRMVAIHPGTTDAAPATVTRDDAAAWAESGTA